MFVMMNLPNTSSCCSINNSTKCK